MSTAFSSAFLPDATQTDVMILDYAALRQEGIRQLERLADSEWTDFNEHDPGITILEQLCYALSDLAYRIDFSLPDLLSEGGANPYSSLHAPALILNSRPVTLMDMRKLVIDVDGVKNAWIETVNESEPVIYFQKQGLPRTDQPAKLDDTKNLIHFANSGNERTKIIKTDGGVAVQPKGLFRVLIEKSPNATNDVVNDVTARLHAHRGLAMDFQSIKVLDSQKIQINTSIEITPQGNPDDIYLAILQKITDYFSPTVTFYSLAERLTANQTMEEIFDGSRLDHGFIDTEQLAKMQRKTSLRTSDLIHAIMDVEGVRLVKYLVFMNQDKEIPWFMELEPDKVPKLDTTTSIFTLVRNQLSIGIDNKALNVRFDKSQSVQARKKLLSNLLEPILPLGRDRQVKKYYSIQHHYPANYGIGAIGLPATADEKRQAQAQQLKAYLLFFDQLLANSFAQLSHIGDLFGFDDSQLSTYFAGSFDDSSLGLEKLWVKEFKGQLDRNEYLGKLVISSPTNDLPRKHRFLDHLLARFAEPFTDYSRFQKNELSPATLAQDKAAILRHYPEFSGGRGTGFNVTQAWDKNNRAGLEQRLRLKLGFTESEQLYLIEHILLRPIESDSNQIAPLLANARFDDPYSLQITLVFAGNSSRFKEKATDFRNFVEQLVREETPAHLIVYVRWLVDDSAKNFSQAYENWQTLQSNFRNHLDQQDLQLKFRDARDRVIDLLEIGQTYPLADLLVKYENLVPWGQLGEITLLSSQNEVLYQLFDQADKLLLDKTTGKSLQVSGNGGNQILKTPEITKAISFVIKATKSHSSLFVTDLGSDGKIHIKDYQPNTTYEFCNADGTSFDPKRIVVIDDNHTLTPPLEMKDEKSFTIRVVKLLTVKLHQAIDIKDGLNKTLTASIESGDLLYHPAENGLADTRLVDYGSISIIKIQDTQAGVDYCLVPADYVLKDTDTKASIALKQISKDFQRGNSGAIELKTIAMKEDTDIRILAIKEFEASENQPTQIAKLKIILSLKVRANPELVVSLENSILDYDTGTIIKIANSQASVQYRAFVRAITDNEFIRGNRTAENKLTVKVSETSSVDIISPNWSLNWNTPPRFSEVGDVTQGNGGEINLNLKNLKVDHLIIIQAHKNHEIKNPTDGTTIKTMTSEIQLRQSVAVLVKPNPNPPLRLQALIENNVLKSPIQVLGGQSGVLYYFKNLGQPVYFHQQNPFDSSNPSKNKGIQGKDDSQNFGLEIEVDFIIAANSPTVKESSNFPPEPPELNVDSLVIDATPLSIRAVKAQTGLEVPLKRNVDELLEQPIPPK
ncbi:MAG: hypothetical protein QX189_14670 [Methylococcales bacterium]